MTNRERLLVSKRRELSTLVMKWTDEGVNYLDIHSILSACLYELLHFVYTEAIKGSAKSTRRRSKP